jgi:thiamine-phosphate diphosphorylase
VSSTPTACTSAAPTPKWRRCARRSARTRSSARPATATAAGALDAQTAGASYVAFGGFYPSRVKKYAVTTKPDILDQARETIRVPTVVIGGMTPENAAPLVARGAHMVAAISSVYQAESVAAAVDRFHTLFATR